MKLNSSHSKLGQMNREGYHQYEYFAVEIADPRSHAVILFDRYSGFMASISNLIRSDILFKKEI
jgi:hypothetical protein